jgi:hypothetical protein
MANCAISSGTSSSVTTKDVGATLALALLEGWLLLALDFCGHSFFQCPFCMQIRQKEFAIRLASDPGPENENFPLPLPFPFLP